MAYDLAGMGALQSRPTCVNCGPIFAVACVHRYYCQEAQEGARNEAAVISALLKKQAAMEEPKKPAAEGEQEALEEQFPWQGKR